LSQLGVEAGATLLDGPKVESGYVGDGLGAVGDAAGF
jgi:hypothetical protein